MKKLSWFQIILIFLAAVAVWELVKLIKAGKSFADSISAFPGQFWSSITSPFSGLTSVFSSTPAVPTLNSMDATTTALANSGSTFDSTSYLNTTDPLFTDSNTNATDNLLPTSF